MTQPNYYLRFEIYGSAFKLLINQIKIYQNLKGKGVSFKYPINPYVFNGNNEVEIILSPLAKALILTEESKCTITILMEEESGKEKPIEIYKHTTPEFTNENPQTSYSHKANFQVTVPFSDSIWKKAPNIQTIQKHRELLLEEYKNIHQILQDKNLQKMIQKTEFREKEIAQCFYLSQSEITKNTREGLEVNFNNSSWVLSEIDEKNIQLIFYANGKLARFEGIKGESPLKYRDEERKLTTSYDFLFCLHPESKQFVIIR